MIPDKVMDEVRKQMEDYAMLSAHIADIDRDISDLNARLVAVEQKRMDEQERFEKIGKTINGYLDIYPDDEENRAQLQEVIAPMLGEIEARRVMG